MEGNELDPAKLFDKWENYVHRVFPYGKRFTDLDLFLCNYNLTLNCI